MTRKDYEVIATALAQALAESKARGVGRGVNIAIEHVTHALQVTEPRFDVGKFKRYLCQECDAILRQ